MLKTVVPLNIFVEKLHLLWYSKISRHLVEQNNIYDPTTHPEFKLKEEEEEMVL